MTNSSVTIRSAKVTLVSNEVQRSTQVSGEYSEVLIEISTLPASLIR